VVVDRLGDVEHGGDRLQRRGRRGRAELGLGGAAPSPRHLADPLRRTIRRHEALEHLCSLQPEGSSGFLAGLLCKYLHSSRELVAALHDAVENGDTAALRDAAHSLKSASAFLGAVKVAALCQSLETMARESSTEAAAATIAALEPEIERARAALEEELGPWRVN